MKILFITTNNILNKINNGGTQCSQRNYRILEQIVGKGNVDICVIADKKDVKKNRTQVYIVEPMKNRAQLFLAGLLLHNTVAKKERRRIEDIITDYCYDIVFDTTRLGRIIKNVKTRAPQVKVITFAHNVEKDIAWQRVQHENILCFSMYFAIRYAEKQSLKYADRFIALSERDGCEFNKVYRRTPELVFPITFTDKNCGDKVYNSSMLSGNSLLFVGSNYLPNIVGIRWFCKQVMPQVNAKLYIVGKGIKECCGELAADNVFVVGEADDLREYYYSADAIVMPITYGGGMKVKTAEALMYGKRIFATSEALAGYERNVRYMNCCDTADDFIGAINRYFREETVQKEFEPVRKIFQLYYDTAVYYEPIKEMLSGLVGEN